MARFKYAGRDRKGKRNGIITAVSRREALNRLKEDGIRVIDISELPETIWTKEISFGSPVKQEHFVIFIRQFATLIKAGVTVVDSVSILSAQTESKQLRRTLIAVESELREGNALSEAIGTHKKIFAPMFVNLIKAGEIGGNLDGTLERLADHFEKQHHTRQKIVSALTYPAVIGVVALGVVIFLLTTIVPTFVDMFADLGGELPAITRFVLGASGFVVDWWWLLFLIVFILMGALMALWQNKETKYYLDYALLRMPLFGNLLQKAVLARLTRTLSSLFSSSVPILQAISTVENVVGNEVIARVIRKSREALEKGQSMTVPMQDHWAFPPLVTQMVAIGEQTGSLDAMLNKIAEFYEKEVDIGTDRIKSLIEPILIVVLAAVVGTIVTSIMVPMFDMFNQFDKKY